MDGRRKYVNCFGTYTVSMFIPEIKKLHVNPLLIKQAFINLN